MWSPGSETLQNGRHFLCPCLRSLRASGETEAAATLCWHQVPEATGSEPWGEGTAGVRCSLSAQSIPPLPSLRGGDFGRRRHSESTLEVPWWRHRGSGSGQGGSGPQVAPLRSQAPCGVGPGGLRAPGQAAMKAFVSQQKTACGPSSTAAADGKSRADVTERNLLAGEWITPWATAHTRLRPRAGQESVRPSPHSATIPLQTPTDGDRSPRSGPAPASGLACPRTWWTLWTLGDGADQGAARGHPAPSLTCVSVFRVRP